MARKKIKIINTKAKKKRAVARATAKPGKGRVRINSRPVEIFEPEILREMIKEPINLAPEVVNNIDISVRTHGGGFMGQAVAARGAIAKAIVEFAGDDKVKNLFIEYDRNLIVDDARRVEPKKPLGPSARAKKQSSKR